ncbi:MAG TPA: UDP-N-acetylglucosamine 2-epimerase (non-hydrolyzing) [Gaiellaceae bacterium]|nr:UDP-N-acetylglucosamine 2-epimerase (non-hydrolyzing) [Gaiellaceae bacterium]
MSTVVFAVGARPNFVKMAPVIEAARRRGLFRRLVVHTGQHYDERLSAEIIDDLGFPQPDRFLGIGSGSHGEQTGFTLVAFERVLLEERPDLVVVSGDVNATLACALAAAKLGVPVAHVESGLRSGDWTMPEEQNRVLTDRLSDFLFTHSPEAEENLVAEGNDPSRIHYVGNTMIDTLRRLERTARAREVWRGLGGDEGAYALVTLHRPSNVDREDRLRRVVDALADLAGRTRVLFPVHPRTRARLAAGDGLERLERAGVACLEPLGYLDFLSLQCGAGAIVTDSGGVQEEASALGVPCYTLRASTERPVTISLGTNTLIGDDPAAISEVPAPSRAGAPRAIPLWDGKAGERVVDVLAAALGAGAGASAAAGA